MLKLSGKTFIITGASRGIGAATARRLAKEQCNVVIIGKTAEPHAQLEGTIHSVAEDVCALGGHALPIQLDVRDEVGIENAVKQTIETFGAIDGLINNAGALFLTKTEETSIKHFDLMLGVNVRATFLFSKACIPHLLNQKNPHIVTVAPAVNMKPYWLEKALPYTITKFGMSICTAGLAAEYGDKGVAVNGIWPQTLIATAAVKHKFPEEMLQQTRKPEIMADAIAVMLQREASSFNGQFVTDESILREESISDFSEYAYGDGGQLITDYYLDE